MKLIRDTGLLQWRYTLQYLRNPVWLFVGLSTPLLYLALFAPLLKSLPGLAGQNVLDIFLPGILALLAFGSGISMGFGTIFELQAGVVERFRVTPTSRLALLLGPLVSGMAWMFLFDLVLVVGRRRVRLPRAPRRACSCSPCCSACSWSRWRRSRSRSALVTKEISALRGGRQRPQPADPAARRRAAADLDRPGVDARAGALQPALLPRHGVALAGDGNVHRRRDVAGVRGARAALRAARWRGRRASTAARSRDIRSSAGSGCGCMHPPGIGACTDPRGGACAAPLIIGGSVAVPAARRRRGRRGRRARWRW